MRLTDVLEKIDVQAKQLEAIGFKGDMLFTSMQQFIDKTIFRLDASQMNEDEVTTIKSFHDPKVLKLILDKYRELKASDASDDINKALVEFTKK